MTNPFHCKMCKGSGFIWHLSPCPVCHGTGFSELAPFLMTLIACALACLFVVVLYALSF
jgi:DnaJ-class molecular chaperone